MYSRTAASSRSHRRYEVPRGPRSAGRRSSGASRGKEVSPPNVNRALPLHLGEGTQSAWLRRRVACAERRPHPGAVKLQESPRPPRRIMMPWLSPEEPRRDSAEGAPSRSERCHKRPNEVTWFTTFGPLQRLFCVCRSPCPSADRASSLNGSEVVSLVMEIEAKPPFLWSRNLRVAICYREHRKYQGARGFHGQPDRGLRQEFRTRP